MDSRASEVMTTEEVAAYLRLSVATVYKLAQAGRIPAARMGRRWRFKREQIDEWFNRQANVDVTLSPMPWS